MKISVLGNIIDTENIYQITPIKFQQYNGGNWEDDSGGYYDEEKIDNATKIRFDILIFNQKSLVIDKLLYIGNKNMTIEEKKTELSKFITLRNVIIGYWSNNQSQIPKIEFV